MTYTLPIVVFLGGIVLLVVAIFGGGLEIKEIKIPTLPALPRVLGGILGCALIGMSFFPGLLPGGVSSTPLPASANSGSTDTRTVTSYQAIPIHYAENQRSLALDLRNYLQSQGLSVNATEDDFSQISEADRAPPGTVRIVYKSSAGDTEHRVVNLMRDKYPDIRGRINERANNGANVDLQIQLW
jgi:hypothetical protein